jgi:hypothetical protein
MSNKLHLMRKAVRLACIWVPTGDARRPLACVWVEANTARGASTVPSADLAGRVHLCA